MHCSDKCLPGSSVSFVLAQTGFADLPSPVAHKLQTAKELGATHGVDASLGDPVDQIRELIMTEASTNVLRVEAREHGMRTLRESGLVKIWQGITTVDEVLRETVA